MSEFKKVFGTHKPSIDEVTLAIAAFEETLVTPNARFDTWLKGDKKALNAQGLCGYQTFKGSGCVPCLKTLTGDQPRRVLPILPPSSDATPRPRPSTDRARPRPVAAASALLLPRPERGFSFGRRARYSAFPFHPIPRRAAAPHAHHVQRHCPPL